MSALTVIVGCLAMIQLSSPAVETRSASTEPDTSAVRIYMELWSGNVLNTFDDTLTKDLVDHDHVTVPISLDPAEIDTILKRALRYGFFALPDTMPREWPENLPREWRVPPNSYSTPDLLRIKWGERDHTVAWYFPISMATQQGKQLFELALFIWDLIRSKEEYEKLPPMDVISDAVTLYPGDDRTTGYLPKRGPVMMHTLPPPKYFWEYRPRHTYFDVYQDGKRVREIVVVCDPRLDVPRDHERLIMLIGDDAGGWMWVREWHYIDSEH